MPPPLHFLVLVTLTRSSPLLSPTSAMSIVCARGPLAFLVTGVLDPNETHLSPLSVLDVFLQGCMRLDRFDSVHYVGVPSLQREKLL